ncbi:MAG: trypsin-like serine protease [Burkholderiales bacterium]|nr:trypsin-like serine protease [Burkholderiales bacterium]
MRIETSDNNGRSGSVFSGTVLASTDTEALVVTCAHGFDENTHKTIVRRVGDSNAYVAEGIGKDHVSDVATLRVKTRGRWEVTPLAEIPAAAGDQIKQIGYPRGAWQQRWRTGQVIDDKTFRTAGGKYPIHLASFNVVQGDSGSPILKDGKLVGIVSGSDGRAHYMPLTVCRFFIRRQCENGNCGNLRPLLGPLQPITRVNRGQDAEIARLKARIEELEARIAQPGPPGPAGPQGPPGERPSLSDAELDLIARKIRAKISGSIRYRVEPFSRK